MQALSLALLSSFAAHVSGTSGCGDCSSVCSSNATSARDMCHCDDQLGRCVCSQEGAALWAGGGCIRATLPLVASGCGQGELFVRALLVIGSLPSPEIRQEHINQGVLSDALAAILQWSTARALNLDPSAVVLVQPGLSSSGAIPGESLELGDALPAASAGVLLTDVRFGICGPADTEWPGGASFERSFRQSAQEFYALRVSSMRFAELTLLHGEAQDARPAASWQSTERTTVAAPAGGPGSSTSKDLWLWMAAASILASVALVVGVIKLISMRRQRAKVTETSTPSFLDFSPVPARTSSQISTGCGRPGASLARAVGPFRPSSDEGRQLVAEAGLETHECLAVEEGDMVEALARGEGWLYGRALNGGLFGYLPEAHVAWTTTRTLNPLDSLPRAACALPLDGTQTEYLDSMASLGHCASSWTLGTVIAPPRLVGDADNLSEVTGSCPLPFAGAHPASSAAAEAATDSRLLRRSTAPKSLELLESPSAPAPSSPCGTRTPSAGAASPPATPESWESCRTPLGHTPRSPCEGPHPPTTPPPLLRRSASDLEEEESMRQQQQWQQQFA